MKPAGTVMWLRECFRQLKRLLRAQPRSQRQLRLCENLQLGERRFLSIVECGTQKFLVGGTATSLAILATVSEPKNSRELLNLACCAAAEHVRGTDEA